MWCGTKINFIIYLYCRWSLSSTSLSLSRCFAQFTGLIVSFCEFIGGKEKRNWPWNISFRQLIYMTGVSSSSLLNYSQMWVNKTRDTPKSGDLQKLTLWENKIVLLCFHFASLIIVFLSWKSPVLASIIWIKTYFTHDKVSSTPFSAPPGKIKGLLDKSDRPWAALPPPPPPSSSSSSSSSQLLFPPSLSTAAAFIPMSAKRIFCLLLTKEQQTIITQKWRCCLDPRVFYSEASFVEKTNEEKTHWTTFLYKMWIIPPETVSIVILLSIGTTWAVFQVILSGLIFVSVI